MTFLYGHITDESELMFEILKYINDRGGSAKIEAIDGAPTNPKDFGDCLMKILKHEIDNSKEMDKIVNLAHEDKDWATFNFGQWFVQEQIEEETLIIDILDKYKLASTEIKGNTNLYEMDRDLANASQEGEIPREEEL